jgi:hypothetical protein
MEKLQEAISLHPGDWDVGVYLSDRIGDDGKPCIGRFLGDFSSNCYEKPALVSLFEEGYTSDFHEFLHLFGFNHEETEGHACPMKAYKGEVCIAHCSWLEQFYTMMILCKVNLCCVVSFSEVFLERGHCRLCKRSGRFYVTHQPMHSKVCF